MMTFRTLALGALMLCKVLAVPSAEEWGSSSAADPYRVKKLPDVHFSVPKSWAGNLPIGGNYGNDSLYFWLWESETWAGKDDLIIWFNGGPACSSLTGLFKIHGPVTFPTTSATPQRNQYSWTKAANVLYLDQPIGTGFSVGSVTNNTDPAANNAATIQWLSSFFEAFPNMRNKKIHLMGESMAGSFLPYIAQGLYQQSSALNVTLSSLSLGNAYWGHPTSLGSAIALPYIGAHRSNYGTTIPQEFFDVLVQADQDCGFADVRTHVTYPPSGPITVPSYPSLTNQTVAPEWNASWCTFNNGGINTPERLQYIINSTGDACFGQCDVYDSAYDFYLNTDPALKRDFQGYNINEHSTSSLYSDDGFVAYLNRSDVKTAIHAPSTVTFQTCNWKLNSDLKLPTIAVVPPAYDVVPTLLGNGIKVNIFSGKLDYVLPYLGNEVVIQNMTWNGQQGFSSPPTVPLLNQYGQTVGSGREERGLSYYAIEDAGHRVAQDAPAAALVWLKEVVVRCDDDWWWWRSKRA